jgi:hypothetical protein
VQLKYENYKDLFKNQNCMSELPEVLQYFCNIYVRILNIVIQRRLLHNILCPSWYSLGFQYTSPKISNFIDPADWLNECDPMRDWPILSKVKIKEDHADIDTHLHTNLKEQQLLKS